MTLLPIFSIVLAAIFALVGVLFLLAGKRRESKIIAVVFVVGALVPLVVGLRAL